MKKVFVILFALVLVLGLGLATAAAPVLADGGTIIHVPDDYPTIHAALNASEDGDTIMVAAGEYDAFVVEDKANINIISAEGATVTTANLVSVDVEPIEDAWVMAAVYESENINIEGINFNGSGVGEEEVVVGIAYVDSTGSIADLTVENILDAELGAGVVIIGDIGTSTVDLSGVTAQNSMAGVAIWNAEVDLNGCTVTETDAGVVIGWPLAGFDPSTVNIQGSTIADNDEAGIWVCDDSTLEAHFNNIVGNTDYGARNDGSEMVDATHNWWGDASGPNHESRNPYGSGDVIEDPFDNVDFEPWLGSEPVTQTVTNDFVYAIDEAATIVEVHNGTATVTISKYAGNPYPEAPIVGEGELASFDVGTLQTDQVALEDSFIDVLVTNYTIGTYVTINIYYTEEQIEDFEENKLRACWTNEDDAEYYLKCSNSNVVTHAQPIGDHDYSGYIWAIIKDNTTPNMDQLTGTTFGGYGSGADLPTKGCFIATSAYGSDTVKELGILREFRDAVLLPNSLGAELVSFYYKTSPPIADFISQHEVLRTAVMVGFVDPIVKILTWSHALWSARASQ